MSHPLVLTDQQRAHLAVAEADTARLVELVRDARTAGLTGLQWQTASSLASGIADQAQRIADLAAGDRIAGRVWATCARLLRDTAARFELWADLAEAAGAVLEVSSHAAHEAA
ncbi:hypothetical protein [Kutzneria buriramensis]|uniref:Excreted virulence factor EspC (Type VII ESX diderm) n=1 Tax=Kutzneria buriramensis TaxID=1045776 RepID=A0A3E0G5S3_9PSEU|nr:hypothetical protein [Kutzneria buriramensis]REH18289.1 hypothetical protein BCF44_13644 [Kutzneria buriramensis]